MVNTNLLLNLSFSILTNFSAIKDFDTTIPASHDGFKRIVVGSPYSAIEVTFIKYDGATFRVRDGVVFGIETSKTYFRAQGDRPLSSYFGKACESKEEMTERVQVLAESLVKSGNPLSLKPEVEAAKPSQTNTIPFFCIGWRSPAKAPVSSAAHFEVDGRSGKLVWMQLWDRGFCDFARAAAISNAVVTPVSRPPKPPPRFVAPFLSEKEFDEIIRKWNDFSTKLGLPAGDTGFSKLDWSRTRRGTNTVLSSKIPVYHLCFTNDLAFEWFDGTIIAGVHPDSCYGSGWQEREAGDWIRFKGKVTLRWEDVARKFEERLFSLGVLKSDLKDSCPGFMFKPLEPGEEGLTRVVIQWRVWPKRIGEISIAESTYIFGAEFDLVTGEMKWILFSADNGMELADKISGIQRAPRVKKPVSKPQPVSKPSDSGVKAKR